MFMVKGTARRVIVVKPPNKKLFEEALFFLRHDSAVGITDDEIIAEAQSVAKSFMRESTATQRSRRLGVPILLALGALGASSVWALALFVLGK